MRVLLIHCYYVLRGGEDNAFDAEYELLAKDHVVEKITFMNKKGAGGAVQFLFSLWNTAKLIQIKKVISNFRPDIIHLHNWHFAAGPLIIRACKSFEIPLIVTLHNYRLLCPSATLTYNGSLFTKSLRSDFPWQAVKKKVYRNSTLQTFWLSFIIWFHNKIGTWNQIDGFICLTHFSKRIFLSSKFKISSDKLYVKPNFTNQLQNLNKHLITHNRAGHFLFVGRLSEEKGIKLLLDTITELPFSLRIAGEGPLEDIVRTYSATKNNITYLGKLNKNEIDAEMRVCSALVFPSIWYEPFGLTIIEAFSNGCPVIASDIGSPKELIEHSKNGLLYKGDDAQSLKAILIHWQNIAHNIKENYCLNALHTFNTKYTPQTNLEIMTQIYTTVINRYQNQPKGKLMVNTIANSQQRL